MADIEVVIKIPEEIYSRILERNRIHTFDNETVCDAIKNGTLLPKGHGSLIDGDEILLWMIYKKIIDKLKCGEVAEVFKRATILEADKESEE